VVQTGHEDADGSPARRRARRADAPASRSHEQGLSQHPPREEQQAQEERSGQDKHRRRPAVNARKAAQYAASHVAEMTGREPEGVTSLERIDSGWRVGIEVLETHRIPDSTDILAVYRVEIDDEGELLSYRRSQRYYRGHAEES
jgi:gas vesicle protein GvpO